MPSRYKLSIVHVTPRNRLSEMKHGQVHYQETYDSDAQFACFSTLNVVTSFECSDSDIFTTVEFHYNHTVGLRVNYVKMPLL